jgi:hypothetical protein
MATTCRQAVSSRDGAAPPLYVLAMPPTGGRLVPALAARRFRELLVAIGEELGNRRGWMSEAARMTGVHRSTVSKVLADDRSVTPFLISRAVSELNLDHEYFSAKGVRGADWRAFLRPFGPTHSHADPDENALADALIASRRVRERLNSSGVGRADVDEFMTAIGRVGYLAVFRMAMRAPDDLGHTIRLALEYERFIHAAGRAEWLAKMTALEAAENGVDRSR